MWPRWPKKKRLRKNTRKMTDARKFFQGKKGEKFKHAFFKFGPKNGSTHTYPHKIDLNLD